MKSEINLMEPELPQLRQMVQKNTERIDRNERLINSMMKGQAEQSGTIKERDEWWENSRREHERDMHDIREILRQGGGQPPVKSEVRAQSNTVGRLRFFWGGEMFENIRVDS